MDVTQGVAKSIPNLRKLSFQVKKNSSMPSFLPMFPLQLVVFPGEDLNLHIFEARYKELVKECQEENSTFGIPAFIGKKVQEVGTEIEVLKIERVHPSGEMDIKTRGLGLFRIDSFHRNVEDKLYSGADIERIDINLEGDPTLYSSILELVTELFQILNINKNLPEDSSSFSTYTIAHHVGLTLEQEYELLCIATEYERQEFIKEHLIRLIPVVRGDGTLEGKSANEWAC